MKRVDVCVAAGCVSRGSEHTVEALREAVRREGLDASLVRRVGCLGLCSAGPLVALPQRGELLANVRASDRVAVAAAVGSLHPPAGPGAPDLANGDAAARVLSSDEPFFARQVRIATRLCGVVDPEDVEDYVEHGGYEALRTALQASTPAEVVAEVTASGLRGRGGAGYPTGLKWSTVAKASPGGGKYVVCNADEGDPGAFMDRSVLESCPQQVLEGMAIAAYAVGASRGYVYVRAEYPLAVARLRVAIEQAEHAGLLGAKVMGTRFGFHVEVRIGAGAFVCGEETALLASIEGKRGTPRTRPPYPAASGLWGAPTLINNVETFASVPPILQRGGEWYAGFGAGRSRGTKVFALAGDVVNSGVVEVPMGTTLREVVMDIGGGTRGGRPLKAVQTGGASGGCIPESQLDLPVDYEAMAGVGSMMGSGGMVVMDDRVCMVDVAAYYMDFCRKESCGKCAPCRAGTAQLHRLLERLRHGEADRDDLEQLEELAAVVARASLCGLGQGAPSPLLSTLRWFREEYLAHVDDRVCPAGACPMELAPRPEVAAR